MAKKKNSWDVAKSKSKKQDKVKEDAKEQEQEVSKMIRIGLSYHNKAKFNGQSMQLQKYIEALIELDQRCAVDWGQLEK